MLSRKEKLVMLFLLEKCNSPKSCLVPASSIIEFVSKKYALTLTELNEIMLCLSKADYIEFVSSESKNGLQYCVQLIAEGKHFLNDQLKEKAKTRNMFLRTIFFAILSFFIGIVLKSIFK